MRRDRPAGDPHAAALREARRRLVVGDRDTARFICEAVLASEPAHPDARHYLGVVAYLEHRYDEAVTLMSAVLGQRRRDAELHDNLGLALQAQGRYAEAARSFRKGLDLSPGAAPYWANLGNALRDAGDVAGARAAYARSLALAPELALAHYGTALCALLAGDWRTPWAGYEWRYAADFGTAYAPDPRDPGRRLPRPSTWASGALETARILAVSEQGLGDELFFLRFAPLLRRRCAWLGYLPSPKLAPVLCRRVDGIDELVTDARHAVDHVVLVGDLPLLARLDAETSAPPPLRLLPEPAALGAARRLLERAGPGPWLALTWRAGPQPEAGEKPGRRKEVPLTLLASALRDWPGTIVSVQRFARPEELSTLAERTGRPIADCGVLNEQLAQMLGLLALVDEYVGVSNTNMYLRAAADRAARVLVTEPPDWRWTSSESRSPWFPAFELYREQPRTGWRPALERLQIALRAHQR